MADERGSGRKDPEIPDRLFFKIGDVSDLTGVEAHVLRFWETEFPALSPRKTPSGQRQYRRKDVALVLEIKRLLYDEKYTIAGARKALRSKSNAPKPEAPPADGAAPGLSPEALQEIRGQLQQILQLLKV